jgi:DUF3006 family protein
MKKEHRWEIDAIEESVAQVDVDGQGTMHVPQWMLPRGVKEGDVLAVSHEVTSQASVLRIERDVKATDALKRATAERQRPFAKPHDEDIRA